MFCHFDSSVSEKARRDIAIGVIGSTRIIIGIGAMFVNPIGAIFGKILKIILEAHPDRPW